MSFSGGPLCEASTSTLDTIIDIDSQYFPFPWSSDQWKTAQSTNNYHLFYHDNLGCFSLFQVSLEDRFAHLLKIVVSKELRRSGIGVELLSVSEEALRKKGVSSIYLEVEVSNTSAQSLYIKSNYKKIHTKKKFYSNGADAHIMEKHLNA